jgi:hypothetical protein
VRGVLLEPPVRNWHCPECGRLDQTREVQPHSRMHPCAALAGLTVPMLPEGVRGEHRAREREDYIAGERVQLDGNGRPVMSVQTIRDEGEDCTVFAPTATGSLRTE